MTRRYGLATMIALGAVGGILAVGGLLYLRAAGRTNQVALAQTPKGVTAVATVARSFQQQRRYVGTVEPWVAAKIGPQLVSAYVDTVLVRPGAKVKRGEVIATLDCRNASATSKAVAAQARALDALKSASASEASRVASLGSFASQNEIDMKNAEAANKEAQLAAMQAQMLSQSLQVDDCVLRSPFDGEVADRQIDPGAFVRPGSAIATVVDRRTVRITADVPEDDFDAVPPGTPVRVHLLATRSDLVAAIARRAPAADAVTRTVHIELDYTPDPAKTPVIEPAVWTTAELSLDAGTAQPALAMPVPAAEIHGAKASVFVVANGAAQLTRVKVIGERDGVLYVEPEPAMAAGALVVTEGRGLLDDRDPVTAKTVPWAP
jgi:RND family efflux transporter MFP subunit